MVTKEANGISRIKTNKELDEFIKHRNIINYVKAQPDGNKRMERQSKGSRGLQAYCKGGQGPLRAVAPPKKKKMLKLNH